MLDDAVYWHRTAGKVKMHSQVMWICLSHLLEGGVDIYSLLTINSFQFCVANPSAGIFYYALILAHMY
jgi:hypothetical protein